MTEFRTSISNKEDKVNKVNTIGSSSTTTQYPSAKAVYDYAEPKIEDTGWKDITMASGFTVYSSTNPMRYRRIGKIVHIEGIFKNTSAVTPSDTAVTFGTISDTTCRPSQMQYQLQQGSQANKFLLNVNPNGNLGIARYGTTATTTQVANGSWLHCYITYFVD